MRNSWDRLILDYLRGRKNLRRVFLLTDSRHGIKKNDEEIMDILDAAAVVYQLVLTKIDQIDHNNLDVTKRIEDQIRDRVGAFPQVLATSSMKGTGISALRSEIVSLISYGV
jgi:GTP-binding protein